MRVNALCPGFFPAEQNRKILDEKRTAIDHGANAAWPASASRRNWSARPCCCCRSKAGSFITGAAYYVDGGFTAMRF